MKHIYYGLKQEAYVYSNDWQIYNYELKLAAGWYGNDRLRDNILSDIEYLKSGNGLIYVDTRFRVIDDEVFIYEKEDSYIPNVGDKVELKNHTGKITSRRHDVVNDIMYYYTDIVVVTIEEDRIKLELETERAKMVAELEELYNKYFIKEDEKVEKKGFWRKLFS